MKIQVLKKDDFPTHVFFERLLKGTEFYQNHDFARAIEEWGSVSRLNFSEPVYLQKIDGRFFCGSAVEEVPFLFFLYAIHINQSTGIGLIKTDGTSKKLIFKKGLIVFAATTSKDERIGNFVVKRKKISSQTLDQLARDAKSQGTKLGRYLVEKKLLTSKALQEILTLQVQEILGGSFFWKKGLYYFVEKPVTEETIVSYTPLKGALIAAQRGFNFNRFRKHIPDNRIIFRLSPYVEETKDRVMQKLNANEEFILSLIDGTRNIEQLIKFSAADEVSLMNILYRLSAMGLIRRTKEAGEYEDKEFTEVSRILNVMFELYRLITVELLHEMGAKGEEIIQKALESLSAEHQIMFLNVPLEEPEKLDMNQILRNIASYFPAPKQRLMFMDAFRSLYLHILDETKKFLGAGLTKETIKKIGTVKADIETFSADTPSKQKMLGILNEIVKKY